MEPLSVLVIDNSLKGQRIAAQVLGNAGLGYTSASTGAEGLALARDGGASLIILADQLPDQDSYALLAELRQLRGPAPVIFVASEYSASSILRAFRSGAIDVVSRPLNPRKTLRAIRRALPSQAVCSERSGAGWEAVLRQAGEVIVVADEENRILLCNEAARTMWGASEGALAGLRVEAILPDDELKTLFADALGHDGPLRREVVLSDERVFSAGLTPVDGVGRVLIMQDISHLKDVDQLKADLVTSVSHDLRTPLTAVRGYLDLLLRVGPLSERQMQFVGRMHDSIDQISDLVDGLLDIAHIEAELSPEMTPCDVAELIDGVIGELNLEAERKAQSLFWERPHELPLVRANRRRLRQAVVNLIDNAIKYTPEGGRISVSVDEEDRHVVTRVMDDGIGIPLAQQARVFDRFFRVESEYTAGVRGTGLGLAIVKAIIEKHGGRVSVESTPGVGSVFALVLPVLGEEP